MTRNLWIIGGLCFLISTIFQIIDTTFILAPILNASACVLF
ncbi:hypothetical protein [Senegalia massiliensis]|nr:hypothetical protein [Senegalia massiliensis]